MKRIISLVLVVLLAAACCGVFASAGAAVGVKSITFASEQDGVVVPAPQGGSDLNCLIDGEEILDAATWSVPGIVLFQNTHCTTANEYPAFSFTLELDKKASVSGVSMTFYEYYNAMIGVPKDNQVTVEYSNDGETFLLIDDFTFTAVASETLVQGETNTIDFASPVEASYIRFTFQYGDSPFTADGKIIWEWIGFSEVGVNATEIEEGGEIVDTSSEAAESSAPAQESSDAGTTDTADSGMIALAVIASLAVAGAVIVKKSR